MRQTNLFDEIIVDNFAGGGGASTGIELAAGRPVAIAINHDPAAILLHRTNHPYTEHLQASVWDVDPVAVCRGRPVGLAWFSPDCKHFSKAKGKALLDRNIRGLAWIVLRWAAKVRPRVIMLENVEEFKTWGPVRKGKPVKKKAGQTFHKWKQQLSDLGYAIEHRELVAADYGAPTTRKRFCLVARCDGQPIVWPEPTHGPRDTEEVRAGKRKPWRSAAEIIDWSVPGYSIFATKQEIWDVYGVKAVRPLANNTMRRIIRGVDKFTIRSGSPFIVECNHGGDGHTRSTEEPVNTVTRKYTGGVCEPMLVPHTFSNTGGSVGADVGSPVNTIRTAGGQILAEAKLNPWIKYTDEYDWKADERLLKQMAKEDEEDEICAANLMSIGHTGGGDRIRDVREPVPTTVSKAEACCVAANLIQYHTEQSEKVRGQGMGEPIMTVDSSNRYGLTCANLVEYYTGGRPLDVDTPLHTVTSHDREALVSAHIQKYFGGIIGAEATEPLPTVTSVDHNALCSAHVVKFKGQEVGTSPVEPLPTVCAKSGSGGFARCYAVLVKANSRENLGNWPKIRELLNAHCGYQLAEDDLILLLVGGGWYFIADITLRMLLPRELYNAMGFPADYIIDRDWTGREYKKSDQVARCGNAVCPPMAEALVRANLPEWCGKKIETMEQLEQAVAG